MILINTNVMRSRLIAIAGALKPSTFDLFGEEFSIGRDTTNHMVINDISMSRRHCVIKKEGESYKLYDLNSRNKTFINGTPSKERILKHGDRLKIGDSQFVFLLNEAESEPFANSVQLEDDPLITNTSLKIATDDALVTMARDLDALLQISMAINSTMEFKELQRQLLLHIFEVVPADCGAVLLVGEDSDDFESMFGIERYQEQQEQPVRVSQTIARQVMRDGNAVLSNDVLRSAEFGSTQSLISSEIRSLICAPLVLHGERLGIIYLVSRNPDVCFERGQLRLVTAIANIAASALARARHVERLASENRRLRTALNIEHDMTGKSARISEIYQLIARIAPTDITVLISGESGTGKELAARAIHNNSPRANKPFVAFNCAAIAETLLESELFGHEKGAFTNAHARRVGPLEAANGGTVFLDEVGEMSHAAQLRLLRVLQEREVVRVGNIHPVKVDLRIIAATNRNLEEAVTQGTFRRDLYFRLNVFQLVMPPLRERIEDILLLAKFFLRKHGEKYGRQIEGFTPEARAHLVNYNWPGNVRELENAIEHALALCGSAHILPEDLPSTVRGTTEGSETARTFAELVRGAKGRFILDALKQTNGDYAAAAELLGMRVNNLHRLMKNLGLKNR